MWQLTEEQEMIQKTVRDWAAAKLAPQAERFEHDKHFSVELYKEFAALGFPGIRYPEALGGGDGGILDMCIWVKELAGRQNAGLRQRGPKGALFKAHR
jgi:alkylation response protein AidB-like acyl-CoA dehydrogenase